MTARSELQILRINYRFFALSIYLVSMIIWMSAAQAQMLSEQQSKMEDYPRVQLQSLDKITARTMSFEVNVGDTVKFGTIYIKIQSCRKAPPIEQPESAAFLQIWEIGANKKAKWIFSGWMFSSSPALSSMDHPIYDVWVIDCLEKTEEEEK